MTPRKRPASSAPDVPPAEGGAAVGSADFRPAGPDPAAAPRDLATAAFARGDLAAARAALEALPAPEPADTLGLATIAYEAGDPERAAALAARAAAAAEAAGRRAVLGLALMLEGEARVALGDAEWGEAAAQQGLAAVWQAGYVPATIVALARWGRILLAQARPDDAAGALAKARDLAAAANVPADAVELQRLAVAIATHAAAPEAASLARDLVARARAEGSPLALAEALLLQATAGFQHGSRPAAREALTEASRLAEAHGFGRLHARLAQLGTGGGVPPAAGRWIDRAVAVELAAREGSEAAMRAAVAALAGTLGAARGVALLTDGFAILSAVHHGAPAEVFGAGVVEHVLVTGEPLFLPDLAADPAFAARPAVREAGLRGAVALPLAGEDGPFGVLLADGPRPFTGLSEADRAQLAVFAHRAGAAIHAARKAEAVAARAETLAGAYRAALAAGAAATPEALLAALAPEAARLCGAARLVLLAGDALKPVASAGEQAAPISTTIARWVFTQARPLHLLDPTLEAPFSLADSVQTLGPRTCDVVPAVHGGRVVGVLYTDHARLDGPGAEGLAALAHLGEIAGAFLARSGG